MRPDEIKIVREVGVPVLTAVITKLEEAANRTKNPFDNIAVWIFKFAVSWLAKEGNIEET